VNHRCETIDELIGEVVNYLMAYNRRARARMVDVSELRPAI
jgi:hypothetical protein